MRDIKTVPRWESFKRALSFVTNPIPVIDEAIEKYGDTYYTRIIGGVKIIMSREPHIAQQVLQRGNKKYQKSELQTESLGKYVGLGLLTANGDYWLRQRRLIQPGFHKAKLASLVEIMDSEIKSFMNELEDRVKKDATVDINNAMMELTLRVVSKSLFSTGIDTEEILEIGLAINKLQQHIIKEVRLPWLNWYRDLIGTTRKAKKMAREVRGMLQDVIDTRKNQSDTQFNDLLDMLMHSKYEDNGASMNSTQVLDEAIILYVAGYETTANTLAWALHALREYPSVAAQLEKEVEQVNTSFTMEQLMQPDYNGQVIEETMRKYPAAWILDRVAIEDDEIDGVEIKKGDLVGLYVFGTHRNPNVWTDPERFDPDRFAIKNKKNIESYAFFPFGGGPRMCIGYHFAMIEMKIALIEFLKRFKLPSKTGQEPDYLPLITLKPASNIVMKLGLK